MKKLIFITVTFMFLCSCSKSETSGASFIHASGIDRTENGVRFSFLLERQNEKKSEYSCVSYEGETPEEAFGKFRSEYPGCYTGSAQLCFFGETLSRRTLYECALFMCEKPVFPSKSRAVSVSSVTAYSVLENIETAEELKKIKNMCYGESPNLAAFFSLCTTPDCTVMLCSLTLENNEIKKQQPVYYRNCAIMQSHYFEKSTKGHV